MTRVIRRRAWTCWASCGSPTVETPGRSGKYDPTNNCVPERKATAFQFANTVHCFACGAGLICTVCNEPINENPRAVGSVGWKHSTC